MFESFLTVTGICAAVYRVWFFWPKVFGSSGAKLSTEEYTWLVIGLFFLPVSAFFAVLTGFFFQFWLSAPASVDFFWWLIIAVPMTLIPRPRGRVIRTENIPHPQKLHMSMISDIPGRDCEA